MSVKITNRGEFTRGIAQETINQILPLVFDANEQELFKIIQEEIKISFGENEIIRGILGYYQGDEEKDIQAIFGLTNDLASDFIDFTINEIDTGLKFSVNRGRDGNGRFAPINTISVRLSKTSQESFIQELLNSPYATYYNDTATKRKRSYDIPWLKWLIEGYHTEAGIDFALSSNQLINSRSGRAIMDGNESGWEWTGNNFLSDIFSNTDFLKRSEKNIKDFLERVISNIT